MGALQPDELAWFQANPRGAYVDFRAAGFARSNSSWNNHRAGLRAAGVVERIGLSGPHGSAPLSADIRPKDGAPHVRHNKPDVSRSDKALLIEAAERQASERDGRRSTHFPEFFIESSAPVPVIFVADWHVGSWGSDHRLADAISDEIERLGLYVAILGDMVQMAVNPSQGLAALHDNAIDESKQMRWLRAWVDRLRPLILWSVWDNHAVIRQEKALGYSEYAELFKEKVIYSSGIAHVDLSIGPSEDDYETYRIATSHRFSGSSDDNPCRGGQQYLMRKALDREIAVCGDSHRPGVLTYPHAEQRRCSINVGSLQTDSSYSKRVASLYTHTDQPIIEFWPDEHAFHVYDSLDDYKKQLALR